MNSTSFSRQQQHAPQPWAPAVLLCLLAFVLSAARVNPGLLNSWLPHGPGIGTDETINLRQGIWLFDAFLQHGPLMMLPGTAQTVYGSPEYLPDYVPLGRFLIGAMHECTGWAIAGAEQAVVNVAAARMASSLALALTVLLLTRVVQRRYGTSTAVVAAALLILMPRVMGHSRFVALETLTGLAWMLALLPLLNGWTGAAAPSSRQAIVSGICWGLLMLVKIQGVLLPPVITVYAFVAFGLAAFRPLALMAATGLTVFFCGWPWLWLDPVTNVQAYLLSATNRLTINNWYLGERLTDITTPWHYPLVMLLTTVPVHCLLGVGLRLLQRRLDRFEWLLLTSIVIPVAIFSRPATPVYDGTRLFLVVMPAIAVLGARGLVQLWDRTSDEPDTSDRLQPETRSPRWLFVTVAVVLSADVLFTVTQHGPFASDSWNSLVAVVPHAPNTMESSYWGTALNGEFWEQVPAGSTVAVAPVMHGVLLPDIMAMNPMVRAKNITLESFQYDPDQQRGLVLLLHRLADLPPGLRQPPPGAEALVEVRHQGTVLAQLVDTSEVTWPERPRW